jgi:4-hydroxy-tetrahydrodipicolinate reductase
MTTICLAGVTGWAGSELARGIANTDDLRLVAAVSRQQAGGNVAQALGIAGVDAPIFATAHQALAPGCDVFVEYTHPSVAQQNVMAALQAGAHVVIGTSGLTDDDLAQIDAVAQRQQRGVLAVGNFALTVALLQKFAVMAARLIPDYEVIDYASASKVDAPSGTARELAAKLGQVRQPQPAVPLDRTVGERGARGATLSGTQVHSVRLPGYVIGAEVLFGLPDQRLSIRVDGGTSAVPYVAGALLAIRGVHDLVGVHRGLDAVLEL